MNRLFNTLAALLLATGSMASTAGDTLTVRLKGMRCEECAHKVKNVLGKMDGVGSIQFNLERRTAMIPYNPQQTCIDSIKSRLEATHRYKASAYDPAEKIARGMGLRMDDMHCQRCADRIMARLGQIEGIDSMAPHLDKHYMFVRYDANKTCKDDIRGVLRNMGFTPVNYYTSKDISFAYFTIPAEHATEETVETVLAIDGVDDANVCPRNKSLAITYVNTETSEQRLIEALEAEGIIATVPAPHECEEQK